ncbi:hypothetical protein Tco_0032993 [Tanacetum coccineum]
MMVKYHKRKKRTQVVITLLPILEFPKRKLHVEVDCYSYALALKGSCTDLFTIRIGIKDTVSMTVGAVNVFKLNMDNKTWEEVDDLKDTMFTMELVVDVSPVLYSSAIASSEFGGSNHLSVWEMPECTKLEDAHAQIVERSVKCDHEVNFNCTKDDSHLLLPTSGYKCRLESDHAESEQEDDMDNDIIVRLVNDPMFGDKYSIKTPLQLICDFEIKCARYGWLLISKPDDSLVFFNPFTSDIRELPELFYISDFCISAPPTSPDCMVVGLAKLDVFIYFVYLASQPMEDLMFIKRWEEKIYVGSVLYVQHRQAAAHLSPSLTNQDSRDGEQDLLSKIVFREREYGVLFTRNMQVGTLATIKSLKILA